MENGSGGDAGERDEVTNLLHELYEMVNDKKVAVIDALVYWDKEIALKVENVLWHYRHLNSDYEIKYDRKNDPLRKKDILWLLMKCSRNNQELSRAIEKAVDW